MLLFFDLQMIKRVTEEIKRAVMQAIGGESPDDQHDFVVSSVKHTPLQDEFKAASTVGDVQKLYPKVVEYCALDIIDKIIERCNSLELGYNSEEINEVIQYLLEVDATRKALKYGEIEEIERCFIRPMLAQVKEAVGQNFKFFFPLQPRHGYKRDLVDRTKYLFIEVPFSFVNGGNLATVSHYIAASLYDNPSIDLQRTNFEKRQKVLAEKGYKIPDLRPIGKEDKATKDHEDLLRAAGYPIIISVSRYSEEIRTQGGLYKLISDHNQC